VNWQAKLAKGLNRIEHGVDRTRLKFMDTFGVRKPLRIHPYIGHANDRKVFLRGRVLLENKVRAPQATDTTWTNFKNMYRRFESDEIPYATVRASVNGTSQTVQCDEEGFFKVQLQPEQGVDHSPYWQSVKLEVIETPISSLDTSQAVTDGQVIVPPKNAQFGVISDLDDTVMKTDAIHLLKMLRNTIFRNAHTRVPFDGVAAFYRALHIGTQNTNNPIFYVSSSPWNLYDMIIDFYKIRGIPLGPIYLRDIGLAAHSIGGESHMGHKLAYIQLLMDRYPSLPFILIGDSGQKDVWVYEEAVRRNPGRVRAIYIRDVTGAERKPSIQAVAEKVEKHYGCELLLVGDTCEAAEHAVANGFIDPAQLPQIREECQHEHPA
jgi:phosphatidate phosphatase APP1